MSGGEDRVDHPHPVWWVLVLGGLTLLAFIALDADFYLAYTAAVHPLPGQTFMLWILIGCAPIHLFEGWYAWRVANRLGLSGSAAGWALQCFMLGYPSTHLLLKRKRAAEAA